MAQAPRPLAHQLSTLTLDNGLEVVLSSERSSPTVAVGVFYRVGFRLEPEGRTGFAHLFEHLMFEGTPRVSQAEFGQLISGAGGVLNGFTRHDYTAYFEVLPSPALEMACFMEADRMARLALNETNLRNQVDVVEQEVRVNVLSQPYGGFSWLWLSQYAFTRFPNAHNFYGDFADLESATLAEARDFHDTWYGPANACLILVGDFDPLRAQELVRRYFEPISSRPAPIPPDVSEPLPTARREFERRDSLAPEPRLALGYPTAPFGHPDHLPLALAARVLTDGRASRLQRRLIRERQLLLQIDGGPHYPIGDAFEFGGPALFTLEAAPRAGVSNAAVLAAIDEEVEKLAEAGPTEDELTRAKRRELSLYHANCDSRMGRMRELGVMTAVHRQPLAVDQLPERFQLLGTHQVQQAVQSWLRSERSTVLNWLPGERPA